MQSYERRNRVREEVQRLQAETEQLEHEHAVLKKGGFETEKVARQRFRFSKPGEEVLYLDAEPTPTPAP